MTAALGATALLAACGPDATEDPAQSATAPTGPTADPALAGACAAFWGDPDYAAPLSRDVLDRAATAPEAGPADPGFYALTAEDLEALAADAPTVLAGPLGTLADWFRTEPERGEDLDGAAFREAWADVAEPCAALSPAAAWALGPGPDGSKPAALVCADVFDTPGTLTVFANANVLTSNLFSLVGLSPQQVPADREQELRGSEELLSAQIAAVDDPAVAAALEEVRAPVQDALDGDLDSPGLRDPLTALGSACADAGYAAPDLSDPAVQAAPPASATPDPTTPLTHGGPA